MSAFIININDALIGPRCLLCTLLFLRNPLVSLIFIMFMPVWQIAPLFLYTINHLNPTALKYFCINQGNQMAFSNLTSPYMSSLALSALFEYLCYGPL